MIEELNEYTAKDVQDLDLLMHELSATSFCNEKILDAIMSDVNSHLYIYRKNDHIVGCACLCVAHSPEFTLGFVESVTVLTEFREQHIGRRLIEHLITEAKRLGVIHLHLTSNPRRIAANGLYLSLGFSKYDTNCFQMIVE